MTELTHVRAYKVQNLQWTVSTMSACCSCLVWRQGMAWDEVLCDWHRAKQDEDPTDNWAYGELAGWPPCRPILAAGMRACMHAVEKAGQQLDPAGYAVTVPRCRCTFAHVQQNVYLL